MHMMRSTVVRDGAIAACSHGCSLLLVADLVNCNRRSKPWCCCALFLLRALVLLELLGMLWQTQLLLLRALRLRAGHAVALTLLDTIICSAGDATDIG